MEVINSGFPKLQTENELMELLSRWMPVLDKVFFFGLVTPVAHEIQIEKKPNADSVGWWDGPTNSIRINLAIPPKCLSLNIHYVCVLTHEMLHAFLHCYSDKARRNRLIQYKGRSGHGPAWCDSMRAIENALQRELEAEKDTT
jgi:hypothetical protein